MNYAWYLCKLRSRNRRFATFYVEMFEPSLHRSPIRLENIWHLQCLYNENEYLISNKDEEAHDENAIAFEHVHDPSYKSNSLAKAKKRD